MLLSYGQCLVQVGSTDISGAFYLPLLLQPPHGTSRSQAGEFPVTLCCYLGPPATPRDLLLAEHNPAPFWGHKTHLCFGLCRERRGVSCRRP